MSRPEVHLQRTTWILFLGLAACASTAQLAPSDPALEPPLEPALEAQVLPDVPEPPAPLSAELFARVAVLGASSAAGFNLQLETGTPTRLADFLDQALLVPHEVVFDGATELFFLDPEGIGESSVREALAARPSLVVAPDFLFWFFYGDGRTTAARRARLEHGLSLLDAFDCPLVIGDLPYMHEAAGGMIPHIAMPMGDSFDAANARLRAWAAEREEVTVLPFVTMNQTLKSGLAYRVGDFVWDPAELGGLLQADHLHPNLAGTALMTLEILSHLAESRGAILAGVALEDPEELVDAVDDLVSSR